MSRDEQDLQAARAAVQRWAMLYPAHLTDGGAVRVQNLPELLSAVASAVEAERERCLWPLEILVQSRTAQTLRFIPLPVLVELVEELRR